MWLIRLYGKRNDRRGEFQSVPEVENLTLVADMSSNILSRPVDVSGLE